ncbi:MAG: glucose-6-phosphate dehydrogenase [Firmicutes bacterium]|nr:glucose-6-phosphate dehydrogenase [Bacillota bacterium]
MQQTIVSTEYADIYLCNSRSPEPCGMVIFGASGDLAHRKLLPALYRLFQDNLLPSQFFIVGAARTEMSHDAFRENVKESLQKFLSPDIYKTPDCENFAKKIYYFPLEYNDPTGYSKLSDFLQNTIEHEQITGGNLVFYLAVPPPVYPDVLQNLGSRGLSKRKNSEEGWRRVIIEKPFGNDLKSAQELTKIARQSFEENQIYRIDHYLGKETVQNILTFRFANTIFEPIWNRNYIDNVQISALETLGVEGRGGYYEQAGALRDMFQNHMLQLLSLVAMEPPAAFNADCIRDEKAKLFRSIRPFPADNLSDFVVRGQYDGGKINGVDSIPYRKEKGVSPDSVTETFAAARFLVDNWRWQGVPFYLRSGKRMAGALTEISIEFKQVPHLFIKSAVSQDLKPNILTFRIQPDEGISLTFEAKRPGPEMCMGQVKMEFLYKSVFGGKISDAYEILLLDCMLGDSTLYNREDGVELCWSLITPMIEKWKTEKPAAFPNYKSGTFGPVESEKLLERDGRKWIVS